MCVIYQYKLNINLVYIYIYTRFYQRGRERVVRRRFQSQSQSSWETVSSSHVWTIVTVCLLDCRHITYGPFCNSLLLDCWHISRIVFSTSWMSPPAYSMGELKCDHVTPVLHDKLHYLRVLQRSHYKCCLLVYKALHGYISIFCTRVRLPDRRAVLCSSTKSHNILVPKI